MNAKQTQQEWVASLKAGDLLTRDYPRIESVVFVPGGKYPRIRVRRSDGKIVSILAHHFFPSA